MNHVKQRTWKSADIKLPRQARKAPRALQHIRICPRIGESHEGKLIAGALVIPCSLGRSGIRRGKREGDGATPAGQHELAFGYFRPDRIKRIHTNIYIKPSTKASGWCDDPASPLYNRPVHLPFRGGHEDLWRDDRLYDVVLVTDYNLSPALNRRGSAIFLHLAGQGFPATAGCVAISASAMRRLLPQLGARCSVTISGF